jgi:uncharacterized protein (TIGR03437 family)
LYFDNVNAAGPAGLLFSATITTTDLGTLPAITKVTNGAGFATGPVSPGELISLFADPSGSNPIGPTPAVQLNSSNCGSPCTLVPTTMGGVQVIFLPQGIAAPLLYVSATQINAVVPYEISAAGSSVSVEVQYLGQASNAFVLQTATTAPGIFTYVGTGSGLAALNQYDPSGNYQGINSASNPASPGWVLVMYVRGAAVAPHEATSQIGSAVVSGAAVNPGNRGSLASVRSILTSSRCDFLGCSAVRLFSRLQSARRAQWRPACRSSAPIPLLIGRQG